MRDRDQSRTLSPNYDVVDIASRLPGIFRLQDPGVAHADQSCGVQKVIRRPWPAVTLAVLPTRMSALQSNSAIEAAICLICSSECERAFAPDLNTSRQRRCDGNRFCDNRNLSRPAAAGERVVPGWRAGTGAREGTTGQLFFCLTLSGVALLFNAPPPRARRYLWL